MAILNATRAYEDVYLEDPEEHPDTPRFRVWLDDRSIVEMLGKIMDAVDRAKEIGRREREARGEAADAADIVHTSKRQEVKELIAVLRKNNPSVENNILKSAENVNLDICLGYVSRGVRHHFMDRYEEGAARGDGADT